jgi:hypothetical protein
MNRPSHMCMHGCVISVNDVERAIHRVFWSSEICAKTEKDKQWQWWMITPDYLLMMFYSRHTQRTVEHHEPQCWLFHGSVISCSIPALAHQWVSFPFHPAMMTLCSSFSAFIQWIHISGEAACLPSCQKCLDWCNGHSLSDDEQTKILQQAAHKYSSQKHVL